MFKRSRRKSFTLCRFRLQISLAQDTVGARPFQGCKKRFERFMGEKYINFKIAHVVTMILESNPTQKASGLHGGVTGKTLPRTAFHGCSVFTFFLRIAPLATSRDTGLGRPVIALCSFLNERHAKACMLTVYFWALKTHLKYTYSVLGFFFCSGKSAA